MHLTGFSQLYFHFPIIPLWSLFCVLAQSRQEGACALAWILYIALSCTSTDHLLASGSADVGVMLSQ